MKQTLMTAATTLMLVIWAATAAAYDIRGRVIDKMSRAPIAYANVSVVGLPTVGATTADDGTFTITNTSVNKYVQFSTQYNSFGSYAEEKGLLPYLYVKDDTATGITDVTVEKEFDENAPIYNISGQRVDKNAKGILIQNGKKFIRR